jgi:murein DD-endopeptidase MepM/ murein hydrolase activator NlpD
MTLICIIASLFFSAQAVHAQSASGPTYIVQPGDTLNDIAQRFGVTLQDLIDANSIQDPNVISAGTVLVIPGLEGITGVLTSKIVLLGENLRSISNTYKIPQALFVKLNRLTSPTELYIGSSIIIPSSDSTNGTGTFIPVTTLSTLLTISTLHQTNPWAYAFSNQITNTWDFIPTDNLFVKSDSQLSAESLISPLINSIQINPLPILQGSTVVIRVKTIKPLTLSGSLNGSELHFFETADNQYTALQGVHAMASIGLTQLTLQGNSDSDHFSIDQMILLESGGFGRDPELSVPSETIDPAVTKPEDDTIKNVISNISGTRYWNGQWKVPIELGLDCIKSKYGNRRSYNGSNYIYFHTGVDFGVCAPTLAITAAADGIVVYTGLLTVRGNTTIIDHGWGVFTAYYHQSNILVKVGDKVTQGQHIGEVGDTGRVTGPHLHFEVWVNGIQVQPLDWLYNEYP